MTSSATDSANRQARVEKITALLQKTEANGCTPQEASAARSMADRLMAKYSITEAECQPQTRRQRTMDDFFTDLFRATKTEADRQANARAQYHRSGVHIDGNSFAENCQCRACQAARNPRPSDACDCDDCTGRRSTRQEAPRPRARRTNTSHAYCGHENSKAARARCRRERGY